MSVVDGYTYRVVISNHNSVFDLRNFETLAAANNYIDEQNYDDEKFEVSLQRYPRSDEWQDISRNGEVKE